MSESRALQSIKNLFAGFFQKFLSLVLIFISRKIFIIYIGVEYLGINSLFSNILSLLCMADLGFGVSMAYSFYKPIANKDYKKISALITFYKKIYNFIAIAIFIIGCAVIPFLDYFVNLDHPIPYLKFYYFIFLLQTVVSYLFVYKGTLLNANQKTYVVNLIMSCVNLVKTIVQIIVVIVFKNYIFFILIQLLSNIIQNLLISRKAEKLYPYIRNKELLDKDSITNIKTNMSSIFIYKVSSVFMNSIDSILISKLISTTILGIYSNYLEVLNGLFSFLNIIFSSVTASVGNLVVTETDDKKYDIFRIMQMVSFFLSSLIIVCLFTTVQDFIQLWLSSNYILDNRTIIFILVNFYLSICMMPLWSYREACGIYVRTKYIMLLSAVLNLLLSLIFAKFLGLAGIIFASTVSRLCTYFWFEPRILFKEVFNKKVYHFFLPFLKNSLVVVVCCMFLWFIENKFIKITISSFLLKNCINLLVVILIYFFMYFRTKEFKMIKGIFMTLIKRG